MKIVIAGSSGFIGSSLVPFLKEKGYELVLLSRNPKGEEHFWDPEKGEIDRTLLQNSDVIINLSGESILGRWNAKKMEAIKKSRLQSTELLCQILAKSESIPSLFINASAIGYYGDRGDESLTETSQHGQGFLSEVCQEWEALPTLLLKPKIRLIFPRFGVVLGKEGGALKQMERSMQMGFGGAIGSGEQMMSWIAMDDLVRAFEHVIVHKELSGPINFVSPEPISNMEFSKTLARVLDRPALLPVPKMMLSMLLGAGADPLLWSTRVYPEALLRSQFHFLYTDLGTTLKKIISS